MSGDSMGNLFKITVWGESHGPSIGVVVEGCPPLMKLDLKKIQKELDKRKPGQNKLVSQRTEDDKFEILSGLFNGKTTGTPLSIIIQNKNSKKKDYEKLKNIYRPSHADFTYEAKYGIRDFYGGGRSSARLTAPIVAAGAIAKQILKECKIDILAYVKKIKDINCEVDSCKITRDKIDKSIINCPDIKKEKDIIKLIEKTKKDGDSIGGVVECVIRNLPVGLGEPLFDKLEGDLAKAMMNINAVKGFEIGNGFQCAELNGSQNNDEFIKVGGKIITKTNNSGGIQGGISNGMPIKFRVAIKPTPSICQKQKTVNKNGKEIEIKINGRHDPCIAIRAVPVVEAMTAIIICDHYLRFKVNGV